ncbi:uncharacterized protein JN550_013731 [Neoarthrinium moseri]|uniref:uncharacterized protein n=1 Tax=Neoarthrinium moseri TaxID=1658444 RepID=UPI001FDD3BFE|nr:uncharacterized protein JN550_013731 [Neoarthrinium moseri]KAI1856667.1 hypothetical protein JN550_013731 [Neoarthrinium moseri]
MSSETEPLLSKNNTVTLLWTSVGTYITKISLHRFQCVDLDQNGRDSLRKNGSLDNVARSMVTLGPLIVLTQLLASWDTLHALAIVLALALLVGNFLLKTLFRQYRAIEDNWRKTVKAVERSSSDIAEKRQEELSASTISRAVAEFTQSLLWLIIISGAMHFWCQGLPDEVYNKIHRDGIAINDHVNKFLKSWVPAWALLKLDVSTPTADGQEGGSWFTRGIVKWCTSPRDSGENTQSEQRVRWSIHFTGTGMDMERFLADLRSQKDMGTIRYNGLEVEKITCDNLHKATEV